MDNPQHYQPLSYALHPPSTSTVQPQATYPQASMFEKAPATDVASHREEEEEEEEEDDEEDDDEGLVEQQLSRNDIQRSNQSSPLPRQSGVSDAHDAESQQLAQDQASIQEREQKRRPGRPRGSKNRKPRSAYQPQLAATAPPQHPEVNAQNQQYYEFQWRVLNLCAEFYTAAEELVKGTPPLVVAQCYHMGPSSKVDPMIILGEAKRVCDTLFANPSQLVSHPPPPIYPVVPTFYQPSMQAQPTYPSVSAPVAASSSKPISTTSIITNPQSFVVPLSAQGSYPHAQYPVYGAAPGQYAATSYYSQYSGYHPGAYYPQQPTASQPVQASTSSAPPSASTSQTAPGIIQGAWSDDETERLKKLAEEHKTSTGEIDWDRVVNQWGAGRTRHQILIKATSLGMKESSSRGVKRRRDADGAVEATSPTLPPTNASTAISAPAASSPASHSESTPAGSPPMQHLQRPSSSSKGPTSSALSSSSNFPYPMPTLAQNIPSPVIASALTSQDQQRTSYYRPRPTTSDSSSSKPPSNSHPSGSHPYLYQPNGSSSSGSRSGRENGK